jgi:hypothetical protein
MPRVGQATKLLTALVGFSFQIVEQVTTESGLTEQEVAVLERSMRTLLSVKTVKFAASSKKGAVKRRVSQG